MTGQIRIRGARQHNLKDVDLDIPRDRLTVVTGLSGSGKSSLAFDTIYAEGQRRYVESLSAYARRLTGGGADADDLLQDTMLRCWTARASFAAGTSLAAWTRTVMKNCFLTGRRRARFHADLPEDARDRRASRGWYARQR